MKIRILFFLLVLLGNFISAQNNIGQIKSIDSLFELTTGKSVYSDRGSKEILRICTEVYYRSKEIKYENGMLHAILKMGETYTNEQQYEEAIKKISEGIPLSEKIQNYDALSQFYLLEAMIYTEIGYTKKSRAALSKSLTKIPHAAKENIPIYKSTVYRTLAKNVKKEKDINHQDSVIIYLHKGYEESEKVDPRIVYKNFYLASFALDLANEYYAVNKIPEAESYLSRFENYLKNEKDRSDFIRFYITKGNIENKRQNYTKALEYFEESQNLIKEYKIYSISLKDIYAGKATAYQGLQDYKNQAFFATKAKKITDSISIIEKKVLNSPLLTDETDLPEEKNFLEKYDRLIYIIIFILFIIAAFFTYRHYSRKKTNLNNDDIDDGLTYENDESEMIENSESFDNQTIDQNNNIEVQSLEELITLARNNDKYFHLKFSKLFPKFNPQLLQINSQLTQSDLEYCALIKLNLSTKEIAQYKNVTVNSVVSKKYRIRKKLSISTNENIYTWMFDIG